MSQITYTSAGSGTSLYSTYTLLSMSNLAAYYSEKGDYSKALELGGESLKIRTQVLGAEHPSTLASMNNLAAYYFIKEISAEP